MSTLFKAAGSREAGRDLRKEENAEQRTAMNGAVGLFHSLQTLVTKLETMTKASSSSTKESLIKGTECVKHVTVTTKDALEAAVNRDINSIKIDDEPNHQSSRTFGL